MFVYYNIIWIVCIFLLLVSLSVLFMRKKAANRVPAASTHPSNFVVVDMNGTPLHNQSTQPATYAPPPPTSSQPPAFTTHRPVDDSVEPPPPSYQDYSKDYRVQQTP